MAEVCVADLSSACVSVWAFAVLKPQKDKAKVAQPTARSQGDCIFAVRGDLAALERGQTLHRPLSLERAASADEQTQAQAQTETGRVIGGRVEMELTLWRRFSREDVRVPESTAQPLAFNSGLFVCDDCVLTVCSYRSASVQFFCSSRRKHAVDRPGPD